MVRTWVRCAGQRAVVAVTVADPLRRVLLRAARRDKEAWARKSTELEPVVGADGRLLPIFAMFILAGVFAGASFMAFPAARALPPDAAKEAPYGAGSSRDASRRRVAGARLPGDDPALVRASLRASA